MRKRNCRVELYFTKDELERLTKKVEKSGLTREAYLRHLINGLVPNDAPPPDYFSMMKQLYGIGNNLNQISSKAHSLDFIDVQRFDSAVREFEQAVKIITESVILPRPIT
ncbi:MAG: plasmid mobilization relaxosome protein MobC [Eubacteriales bacterium]|nr:plasmid mobilization relaxosome protein MobC [Eubacteriales bacterium]